MLWEYGPAVAFEDPHRLILRALKTQNHEFKAKLGLRLEPFQVDPANGKTVVRARGVSGSLRVGKDWIDIAPQFSSDRRHENWSEALLNIMFRARAAGSYAIPLGSIDRLVARTFIDHVGATFANYLQKAHSSGIIRTYSEHVDSGNAVRGRILMGPNEVASLVSRPGIVSFEESILSPNNDLNHLLLWAANELIHAVKDAGIRALIRRAIAPIADVVPKISHPRRVTPLLPRQYGEYKIPIEIARGLLSGQSALVAADGIAGFSLLVSTFQIYEQFIERTINLVASRLGLLSRRQASIRYGEPDGAYPALQTRPDVVVHDSFGTPLLIVDAKYKFIDKSLARAGTASDYYQLLTSMIAHGVSRGLLIFPASVWNRAGDIKSWSVNIKGNTYRLYSAVIDIARFVGPIGRTEVDAAISNCLSMALEGRRAA